MIKLIDGPASAKFSPLKFETGFHMDDQIVSILPEGMKKSIDAAPSGDCVAWGIPFSAKEIILIKENPVCVKFDPVQTEWLVFMHTADELPMELNAQGVVSPMRGVGQLNEHAADYVFQYDDGSEERVQIRRRLQVGTYAHFWEENGLGCVPAHKPQPIRASHEQLRVNWGQSQTRVTTRNNTPWRNWLWAWQNPYPEKKLTGIRFEPKNGLVLISAISHGNIDEPPLRWRRRRKAVLHLPEGITFQPSMDSEGLLAQIQLDLGQVISAQTRLLYPNDDWENSYNNQLPSQSQDEVIVEYTSHAKACFHLSDGQVIPVADVESSAAKNILEPISPAVQRVVIKVIDKHSRKTVAVKMHIHGLAGEYLAPVDRHRIINTAWFEDYSVDFIHRNVHSSTYIPGETVVDLPLGKVYIEVSKGFEIRPVRKVIEISRETEEILITLERVLPWREKGWVTADTHVHFLSPGSAMLEGAGEDVNIVNLLASQWGELMTNVGDFDGKTTWGEVGSGGGPEGNGEYLVRVGTENRQNVLGHISLLGYQGRIIAPMTSGGPDESALGDPVEVLLSDWARQCKAQGGIVVAPHFPYPRAEHAAGIVLGDIEAVEMTGWDDLYRGIDPYSLSDWYRYLNCGYLVPAVGGTDKMVANVAVGAVRTYARIDPNLPFVFSAWMDAIRRADTFVTYGPLVEFAVDGKPAGSRIFMSARGGTVDVSWQVASVTVPMSRVDLMVNGEIRESVAVDPSNGAGSWKVQVGKSSWIALLVRGHYADKPEIVAAHTSPVFVQVENSEMFTPIDAVTILEQIEGTLVYLDSVGIRAEDRNYKRMRLILTAAHRALHNRMHQAGSFHEHNVTHRHMDGHEG